MHDALRRINQLTYLGAPLHADLHLSNYVRLFEHALAIGP